MNRDDFEEWVSDHLSEAIEDLRDIECSNKKWIVMLNDSLLAIAKRDDDDAEPDNDDVEDDLVLARGDEDEA